MSIVFVFVFLVKSIYAVSIEKNNFYWLPTQHVNISSGNPWPTRRRLHACKGGRARARAGTKASNRSGQSTEHSRQRNRLLGSDARYVVLALASAPPHWNFAENIIICSASCAPPDSYGHAVRPSRVYAIANAILIKSNGRSDGADNSKPHLVSRIPSAPIRLPPGIATHTSCAMLLWHVGDA